VLSVLTVCVAPDIVIVLVPFVKTEDAPDVSHDPETVQEPEVSKIVPDVPPVIVTLPTVTVAWFPFTIPPLVTVRPFAPKANVPVLPATSVRVPVTETAPLGVIVPVVMLNVVPEPTVMAPAVMEDVVPVMPPVPTREIAAPPVILWPEVVRAPELDVAKVPDTSIAVV